MSNNLIGQSLGRYHILEQLGEGGMAIVYKAYDTRLETDVAVKVIRTENLAPSVLERSLKRFEREAKALARLTHPNIVKVTDYGEFEGKPYLVMPYLPGGTLKDRIKQGQIPWQEAARLILPIAQALEYAHEHEIIHRDVKPSNILLTEKGQPMLTDFGVAKLFDMEATADLTGTGMGIGTPEYMAPEQWQGRVSEQTDVYALGVVLYEMVTGRRPYTADTPAAILLKQASGPLPRPTQYVRDLPKKVEKILWKTLTKEPADRYLKMGDFAKVLESLLSVTSGGEKKEPIPQPKRTQDALQGDAGPGEVDDGLAASPPHVEQKLSPPAASFLKRYQLGIISVLIVVGLCIVGVFWAKSYDGLALFPTYPPALIHTATATYTPVATLTHTPTATYTPIATLTPSKTSTSIKSPTATLSLLPLGEWTISISVYYYLNNPYVTQTFKINIREGGILIRDGVMYSNNRGKMTVNNIGEVQGSWTLEGNQVTLIFAGNNWLGVLDGKMIIGINRIGDHGSWSAVYNNK